eukprot:g4269.t1
MSNPLPPRAPSSAKKKRFPSSRTSTNDSVSSKDDDSVVNGRTPPRGPRKSRMESLKFEGVDTGYVVPASQEGSGSPKSRTNHYRGPLWVKKLVSKKKNRLETEDGFNLDMTYITPNIIAMGYPADGAEALYRNHYKDTYEYFESRHEGKYKFYNLCSERQYDPSKFHGRVVRYPFDDHHPPPLDLFLPFCVDLLEWLLLDDENVAAIHCKAGKGRTGVMICAFMVYCMNMSTADALQQYGVRRTRDSKGVTLAGQRRFIHYFAQLSTRPYGYSYIQTERFGIDSAALAAAEAEKALADSTGEAGEDGNSTPNNVYGNLDQAGIVEKASGEVCETETVYLRHLTILDPPPWMRRGNMLRIEICTNYWDSPTTYTIKPPKGRRSILFGSSSEEKSDEAATGYTMEVTDSLLEGDDERTNVRGADGTIVYHFPASIPIIAETRITFYKLRKGMLGDKKPKKKLYVWVHSSFVERADSASVQNGAKPGADFWAAADEAKQKKQTAASRERIPEKVSREQARLYDGKSGVKWDEGRWEATAKDEDGNITRAQWLSIVAEREPGVNALCKLEIDGCHKDIKHKKYPPGFGIEFLCTSDKPEIKEDTAIMKGITTESNRVFILDDEERAELMKKARSFAGSSAHAAMATRTGSQLALKFTKSMREAAAAGGEQQDTSDSSDDDDA